MKLFLRIPGEDLNLFACLRSERADPILIKGAILVELKEQVNDLTYIEEFLPEDHSFYIEFYEFGGGMTKTGHATVACKDDGTMLIPIHVPTTGHLANRIHAYFEEEKAVIITSTKNGNITISGIRVAGTKDGMFIEENEIWEGKFTQRPETYVRFSSAALAAHMKANCFHCRHVHYGNTE